jgi:hypothetical protein
LIDANLVEELGAEAVHDRDDRKRDAGRNQSVFDRRRTCLVGKKPVQS